MSKITVNYLVGAKMAMENAAALQDTARIAAERGNYGLASSLAILSAEEAIKGFFCLRKHYPISDPVNEFDKIFKDHKIKHEHIIEVMKWMPTVLHESMNILNDVRNNLDGYLAYKGLSLSIEHRKQLELLLIQLSAIAQKPLSDAQRTISEFWNRANHFKNQGLYVGLSNDRWHDPAETDVKFWDKANDYTEIILLYTGGFMGLNAIHLLFGNRPEIEHPG